MKVNLNGVNNVLVQRHTAQDAAELMRDPAKATTPVAVFGGPTGSVDLDALGAGAAAKEFTVKIGGKDQTVVLEALDASKPIDEATATAVLANGVASEADGNTAIQAANAKL